MPPRILPFRPAAACHIFFRQLTPRRRRRHRHWHRRRHLPPTTTYHHLPPPTTTYHHHHHPHHTSAEIKSCEVTGVEECYIISLESGKLMRARRAQLEPLEGGGGDGSDDEVLLKPISSSASAAETSPLSAVVRFVIS